MAEYKPLEVINTGFRTDKLVGEISNPNDYEIPTAYVGIVGKDADGNIIVMEMTFVDNVPANGSAPFDISIWSMDGLIDKIADYQVFANQW